MTDLPAIVEEIDALGPPFLVSHGTDTVAGAGVEVFDAARLVDPADDETPTMVRLHAKARGMPVGRHLGSLVFQRYSHRVCGVAVAAWLRYGIALDVSAANTRMRFEGGTPVELELIEVREAGPGTVEAVVETAVTGHLLPLAEVVSAYSGPRLPNLWGNMAAGFAGAFRTLSVGHDAFDTQVRARELLAVRPELARGGSFRILDGPTGARLYYDRASCCHWYAAPDGRHCSWCSKIGCDERTRRFYEAMSQQ